MLRVERLTAGAAGAALTFDVPHGKCVGLLGRDAVTLLHLAECVCGIRVPATGRVLIDDLDVLRDHERTRVRIAVTLARAAHSLTSLGEHATTMAATRRPRMKAADAIARLGLRAEMRLNTPAAKSAAALVGALIPDASLVILHDPFQELSDDTRAKAIEWIRSLAASETSFLMMGTEERDVRAVSHSVIEIGAGR